VSTKNEKAIAAVKFRQKKAQLLLMQTMAAQRRNNGLNKDSRPYRHLVNYIDKPNTLLSLFANPKDVTPFVYATPDQLGSLVPMMEFYYSENKKNSKGEQKPDEKILFSDYIQMADRSIDGKVLASPQQLRYAEQILLGDRGTLGTGVGIKEFSWQFDNKHEGDKTIKASLRIFFGSVREMLNEEFLRFIFVNSTDSLKGADLPEDEIGEQEEQRSILSTLAKAYDLMGEQGLTSSKKRFGPDERPKIAGMPPAGNKRQDRSLRILKAKVGWAVPRGRISGNLDDSFLSAVEATQKVIALHLVSYKLNFQQEGQVELSIEYVGSLDSILSSEYVSNVLEDPDNKEPIQKKRIRISKIMEDNVSTKKFVDYAYKGSGPVPHSKGIARSPRQIWTKKGDVKGIIARQILQSKGDTFAVSINDVQFELAILNLHKEYVERFDKTNEVVKKNLDRGIEACRAALSQINSKIRHSKYSKFMTNLYTNRKLYYVTVEARNLLKPKAYEGTRRNVRVEGRVNVGESDTEGQRDASGRLRKAMDDQAKKERKQNVEGKANVLDPFGNTNVSPDATESDTKINLFYFKLGDILEEALNGMHSFVGVKPRILLGSFKPEMFDLPGVGKKENYPLADLPISSDYFGQWFLQTFVQSEPPVEAISFRRFVDALLNDLAAPIINDAFANESKPKMSFSMASFVSSMDFERGDVIDEANLQDVAEKQGSGNSLTSAARHDYFIIFAEQTDKNLEGNFAQDTAKGIYHFTLGSDRGLVKTFSFSEKKMPQLRALNIENAQQGSALILPQDLELTMVGNTLFRNGQIIYINADLTLGSKVASKLGLGGYYMVVKSENTISMSTFETTLTCMWQKRPGKG